MLLSTRLLVVFIYLGVTQAVIFNGTTFHEEYVCEADGRIAGVCEENSECKPPASGRGDCGVQGSKLVCCSSGTSSASPTGSKSRAKCAEYSKIDHMSECPAFRPFSGDNKVVPGEHPYSVALGYRNRDKPEEKVTWLCAGSLISERYVLTTYVCIQGRKNVGAPQLVRIGALDLNSQNALDFGIEKFISHPDYSRTNYYNNIGLLKLDKDVAFSKTVRPACLHTEFTIPASRGVVAAWGKTSFIDGAASSVLNKVDLPLVPHKTCNEKYTQHKGGIDDAIMLCAGGGPEGGKDTCSGDMGAPLVMKLAKPYCTYSIIGITSFGPTVCGIPNKPGVYTRVSHYIPWIESVVWPN